MAKFRLISPALWVALGFLLIQQCIVALSTYFIAKLAQDIMGHQSFAPSLIGFVLSLVVVYVPAYWAVVALQRAKFDSLNSYIQAFWANLLGKTTSLNDRTLKDQQTAIIAQESKPVIDETFDFIFDSTALLLNLVLNIIVLSVVLDKFMLIAYATGLVLAIIFVGRQNPKISHIAKIAQATRLNLLSLLNKTWDNILIDNTPNQGIFYWQYKILFERAKRHHINACAINHRSASIGMGLFMLPVIGLTIFLFVYHQDNLSLLAMLTATLPRQIQLLQVGQTLIFQQANFASIKAKLTGLTDALTTPSNHLIEHIKLDKLQINGQAFDKQGFDKFKNFTQIDKLNHFIHHLPKTGRLTITGQNGAGKSSLLLLIKQTLAKQAYYLPAKHELVFYPTINQSTGQALDTQLQCINAHLGDIGVLMLDEWDANLDNTNKMRLNALIDELAKRCLVIEVRHY